MMFTFNMTMEIHHVTIYVKENRINCSGTLKLEEAGAKEGQRGHVNFTTSPELMKLLEQEVAKALKHGGSF